LPGPSRKHTLTRGPTSFSLVASLLSSACLVPPLLPRGSRRRHTERRKRREGEGEGEGERTKGGESERERGRDEEGAGLLLRYCRRHGGCFLLGCRRAPGLVGRRQRVAPVAGRGLLLPRRRLRPRLRRRTGTPSLPSSATRPLLASSGLTGQGTAARGRGDCCLISAAIRRLVPRLPQKPNLFCPPAALRLLLLWGGARSTGQRSNLDLGTGLDPHLCPLCHAPHLQIQLIRIQRRVPEFGWTTQKVFHLMNFLVNGGN